MGILIAFIYDRIGLYNLGQANMLIIFFAYSIASFYPNTILGFFKELKIGLAVGFFVNGLQIFAAIMTYSCYSLESNTGLCSVKFLGFLNLSVAALIGFFSNVFLWTGNYEFVDRLSTKAEKKFMFATYNSYLFFNNVTANLLNIIFYSYEVNSLYVFSGSFVIFMVVTSGIYWFLPDLHGYVPEEDPQEHPVVQEKPEEVSCKLKDIQELQAIELKKLKSGPLDTQSGALAVPLVEPESKEKEENVKTNPNSKPASSRDLRSKEKESFMKTANLYMNLLHEDKYYAILPYLIQSGLFQGFSAGAIYRLVVAVYAGNQSVNEAYVKKMISVVLIGYSISALIVSQIHKTLDTKTRNNIMKANSCLFAILMICQVFFSQYLTNIWLVAIPSLIFGAIDLTFQQLIAVYLSESFEGSTEPYALFKLIQNFICSIFMAVYIASSYSTYTILNAVSHVGLAIWFVAVFDRYNGTHRIEN